MYFLIKLIISALMIALISEISKRNSVLGSILASVPLVSVIAIIWLYKDTKDVMAVSKLSKDIFWLVIPSLSFFVTLPLLLKKQVNFYLAISISLIVMITLYFLMIKIMTVFKL